MSGLRVILLLPALSLMSELRAAPLPRSISSSRQFIIYGVDVPLRGAVAEVAERTKATLLRVLQKRDDWKTPIVVNLQFPQANVPETPAAQLRFSQTGFGLKLQLDLTIVPEVNAPSLQRELLRALLLELIYRNHSEIAPGTAYVQPPDWLLEAFLANEGNGEHETLAEALATAGESGQILPLDQFLRQRPEQFDSPARLIYRAYSAALLQLLTSSPEGAARLGAYLDNLGRASNDPLADLNSHFPFLRGSGDPNVPWKTAVTKFASANRYRLLSFSETQRQLVELLQTKIPALAGSSKFFPLENVSGTKVTAKERAAFHLLSQNLLLLSTVSNPVMRPVVVEYEQIAQLISAGKRAGLGSRLAQVKANRLGLAKRMNEIDDYMNWFEATQLQTGSGIFKSYLKAAGDSNETRRKDALSVYLDAVEAQFQN